MSRNRAPSSDRAESPEPDEEEVIERVKDALQNLRFGQVTVIVQDGVVVQIDRLERRRLLKTRVGGQ